MCRGQRPLGLPLRLSPSFSSNFWLDPTEERLVAGLAVAHGAFLCGRCPTNGHIALLLLVRDQRRLHQSVTGIVGCEVAGRSVHAPSRLEVLTAVTRLLEIVSLPRSRWLECGLVKAEMIVFLVSVSLLRFGDACPVVVWIAAFVESLVVRRLEIVVHLSTLLLLA